MSLWWIVVLVVAGAAIWLYNSLIGSGTTCGTRGRKSTSQLKRRHDLIPNLVGAVKGYMQHEREVLDRVIEARARAIAARGATVPARPRANSPPRWAV